MPDLQTELSKVINNWTQTEKPMEQQTAPTPTPAPTHVGQAVFELVKTHPGRTMAEYEQLASSVGVSAASVKNYIVNFSKASWGLAKCDNDRYTVNSETYKTKNEMMGLPKGLRLSQAKRRRLMKARTEPVAQVGKGVLQDLLMGQVNIRPGIPRGTLVAFAVKHGMKEDSAKVTIRALIKGGRLVERDGSLFLPAFLQDTHSQPAADAKPVEKHVEPPTNKIDIESLTIRQARELYDQLAKFFSF